ncbi:hypothetical protein [Actinomadura violacea]|uniref:Uncharacterized protein n=1 Tax=Actinomadura violacea TaxID=2819934 RepID=A0ABS3RYS7_9ACTN|nr:hypothetical protein [Actinomadura violacea]MBO2461613.1 hypothetical protein [Actinomadura violacea]
MDATTTHPVLTVRTGEHDAADPAWRVAHANETIQHVTLAYFEGNADGTPRQADDGTFRVHAVARGTLDALRDILTRHELFEIVAETEEAGTGIIVAFPSGQ